MSEFTPHKNIREIQKKKNGNKVKAVKQASADTSTHIRKHTHVYVHYYGAYWKILNLLGRKSHENHKLTLFYLENW